MKRLLLIICLLGSLDGFSQARLKIINTTGYEFPLTVPVSGTVNFDLVVGNIDSTFVFNDTLLIYVAVLDTLGQKQVMDIVDLGLKFISIADTIIVNIDVDIIPSYFQEGNNTVVIWPACPNTFTEDSAYFTTDFNLGLYYLNDPDELTIYPNPTDHFLDISWRGDIPEEVRIYDLQGRLLMQQLGAGRMDISALSKGIYYLQVYRNRENHGIKIIKY